MNVVIFSHTFKSTTSESEVNEVSKEDVKSAFDLSATIHINRTELDAAIKDAERLCELLREASALSHGVSVSADIKM